MRWFEYEGVYGFPNSKYGKKVRKIRKARSGAR